MPLSQAHLTFVHNKIVAMKKFPKIILLLLVLAPSVFFLSRAFAGTKAELMEGKLVVTGPGSFELPLEDIKEINWVEAMPELSGTGGFSLGWVKKGDFIRSSDKESVRIIKNREAGFIHLITTGKEIYFNLDTETGTHRLLEKLKAARSLD
jgi:hypothetical protein